MKPPWREFPDIPARSIGWRMGRGEGYYDEFYQWFSSLEEGDQLKYMQENPEPRGWKGFYKTILSHPWIV
jgi:hypothetical protein